MDSNAAREQISKAPDLATVSITTELQVVIPHRSPEMTRAALKYAATLATDLNIRLRLIDVHVVPYGFPLNKPTVSPRYLSRKLRSCAEESTLPISADIVFARDWEQGFRRALGPSSVVLMPIKRSWWRTSDKRMAARLRKSGHQIVWVEL
jgi:hypothetical protein